MTQTKSQKDPSLMVDIGHDPAATMSCADYCDWVFSF
jgi:hypothetical protein